MRTEDDRFTAHTTWFKDRINRSSSPYKDCFAEKEWWMEPGRDQVKKLDITKLHPIYRHFVPTRAIMLKLI
jgi:hypothetical protein